MPTDGHRAQSLKNEEEVACTQATQTTGRGMKVMEHLIVASDLVRVLRAGAEKLHS
jgi:hypothetical protein